MAHQLWPTSGDSKRTPVTIRITALDAGADLEDTVERWQVDRPSFTVAIPSHLRITTDVAAGTVEGTVSRPFLTAHGAHARRLCLETPAAILLAHRDWIAIHGAAICGPAGAVVIRGGNGTGKSTLVAAAAARGIAVFGDETVLVKRDTATQVAAGVHEILVRPTSARLLDASEDLGWTTTPAGDRKLRVSSGPPLTPSERVAPHLATILLGDRTLGGNACLTPLDRDAFQSEFREGEIIQERWAGSPDPVAESWTARPTFRLDGHTDLSGAIRLIRGLIGHAGDRP